MTTFPAALPHGPVARVAEGVHAVRGSFRMGPGVMIDRTMTVLQGDDGLVVLNAVRLSEQGEAELEALGKVKHLVKLSDSHGIDEPYYVDRFSPETWTLEGAKLDNGIPAGRTLGPDSPIEGAKVIDLKDAEGWREAAFRAPQGGGTLVTCDSIQNCAEPQYFSFMGRIVTSLMGFKGGVVVPPMWRKFQKVQGGRVRDVLSPLVAEGFDNHVSGHGPWVSGGASAAVKGAIEAGAA